ncbi:UDP-glucose 4-epimerase GalE [Rubellimicrobium arenae]|uniref:UDP-glucose 4-epimerase GalE n=1 Tax=Rubellimicrobium arenae TaxID=2817372 RepID=UPI001B307A83|nr:UDP-glucose 4-epimerase GalE [Rubellimicrobium arenae]
MRVLVTGGAGYIGSHTLVELLGQGHEALVVDSFSNSSPQALDRVRELTNGWFESEEADIRDTDRLTAAARRFRPEAVIHFAGLKSVGESARRAVDYYDVNVAGTVSLLRAMDAADCRRIIFSSSATVYGEPQYLPFDESHRIAPTNVYGQTKAMAEQLLTDWARADEGRAALLLRYFNPVGAHASGRMGEDPRGVPENLMPFLAQVAAGRRDALRIWGDDYPTPDGTGVRDYIHVTDLARAHVAALARAQAVTGAEAYNIGTGHGVSVREMLGAFQRVVGRDLPHEIHPRRPGDVAEMRADCSRANRDLGWRAEYDVDDMVQSLWAWQSANPYGYGAPPQEG